jgi:hypothetical protein
VVGLSVEAVKEWLALSSINVDRRKAIMAGAPSATHQGDMRSTRRQIARGRKLWVLLAAWPWWAVVDGGEVVAGGMPSAWWTLARIVETYQTWLRLAPDGRRA